MSCCTDPRAGFVGQLGTLPDDFADGVTGDAGAFQLTVSVPDVHCAGCIAAIERAIARLSADVRANVRGRVNVTRRTVTIAWEGAAFDPSAAITAVRNLGYVVRPLTPSQAKDERGAALLRALAVAGFASMNVMLLSVSVWAGAEDSTRAVMNWFAALIALPALTYAGRPFFRSALSALGSWRLNMDVPISLAILLAAGLSLAKTISGEGETYFDAAITLTFFLLAGRVLDHMTRERARDAIGRLARLRPTVAHVVTADGLVERVHVDAVEPGMALEMAAGERVPVDALLCGGPNQFDASLVTGEAQPATMRAGEEVAAGLLAMSGPVRVIALRPAADSLLARLASLQAAAEAARPGIARITDKAAQVYAPVVHLTALATLCGWLLVGSSVSDALTTAIAVLIITCPCALGLAVPMVHVAASDRLFRLGLVVKHGGALERLRQVDEVVFDKTGTLTRPALDPKVDLSEGVLEEAAALARHSTHPVSRAVERAAQERQLMLPPVRDVVEHVGQGVSGIISGRMVYLGRGRAPWENGMAAGTSGALELHQEGRQPTPIPVTETLRTGASSLVGALERAGYPCSIVSGDDALAVRHVASAVGITDWASNCAPADKVVRLQAHIGAGARPLMVGDGLNDGPALASAHVSIAVAEASDLANAAADFVMTTDRLEDIAIAIGVSKQAYRLMLQNFAIAASYNMVCVPLAVLGYATPLAAAIAMSMSSILVTLNSLRIVRTR